MACFCGMQAKSSYMAPKLILCALLFFHIHSLYAQDHNEGILIESKPLQSAGITSVKAETDNGNISVEGVRDSEARVEVYAWARKSDEKVKQEFADLYELTINTNNNTLTINCKAKKRDRDGRLSVSFRVYAPAGSSTELHTSGGNLHIMKLTGRKHRLHTSGGNIAFDEVKGDISGKTSGGNISISHCSESVDVSTSGGNISARESNGNLQLFTSGGNISIDDLSGKTKAETSGGNIAASDISGELSTSSSGGNLSLVRMTCALEASTGGGNMEVEMNKLGTYVKLRNRGSGHTKLQIPEGSGVDLSATGHSVKIDDVRGFSGDIKEREVKGKLGNGGIPVTIDGGDSRVVITLK